MISEVKAMCGRYSIGEISGLTERFGIGQLSIELKPRYNVAPSQDVPVILKNGSKRVDLFRWGLIPRWAKDPSLGHKLINARAETLDAKPSFAEPFRKRRCLVIADGFYEWKREGKSKRPYRIILKNREPFGFAGLWDSWQSPTGEIINSCTIITTAPNALMAPLHDRMPVILGREAESVWLDGSIRDSRILQTLLQPFPAELITAYEVTSVVNSPGNDVPECFVPANLKDFLG